MPTSELDELGVWIEPGRAFEALSERHQNVFWLDDALQSGWSYVGFGSTLSGVVPSPALTATPVAGEPRFRGGWVGWHSYEGESRFLRVEAMLAFDHGRHRVLGHGDIADAFHDPVGSAATAAVDGSRVLGQWRHDDDAYLTMISECQEAIRAGDAYQLCLTNMWHSPHQPGDPLALWQRLRAASPSHHGGFLRLGDTTLLSTSPEQFIAIETDGTIRTRPIKGTRPRGATPLEDAALAHELAENTKERAENLMIVDLMRNDVSRVAEVGSVRVPELLAVETYRHVHQLVSTVSARLRPGVGPAEVLDALFPAGSMTGAPKRSAMSILRRLEGGDRGIYSGAFGFIGDDGTTELAMVIRSIVIGPDGTSIGAGGGITVLSEPAAELAEQKLKASALIGALASDGAVPGKAW